MKLEQHFMTLPVMATPIVQYCLYTSKVYNHSSTFVQAVCMHISKIIAS